jgi:hypothetical protein
VTTLPSRPHTIGADDDATYCRVVGDMPAADGTAHPMWGFILSRRTLVLDLHELLALVDFDVADGPMLGEFDMVNAVPFRVGETYDADITMGGLTRKTGRSGAFDLFDVTYAYRAAAGASAGTYRQTYVLPRR